MKKITTLYLSEITHTILSELKSANAPFYKNLDNVILCALTDHLLRLKTSGELKELCEKNPELKKLIPKVISKPNSFSINSLVFEKSQNPSTVVSARTGLRKPMPGGSQKMMGSSHNHLFKKKEEINNNLEKGRVVTPPVAERR